MKHILLIMSVLLFASCAKNKVETEAYGTFSLEVKAAGEYQEKVKSGEADVDVTQFIVNISKKDGKYSKTWKYIDMPSLVELSPGEFTVSVASQLENTVSWDTPYYGVTKDFAIVAGKVTNLDLVCKLQNMKMSIYCSEVFLEKLSDFDVKVICEDESFLLWTKNEVGQYKEADKSVIAEPAKTGYFPVGPLTLVVDGYRALDQSVATLTYSIKDVAAADHHIVYLDAYVTGQTSVSIRVDASTNDVPIDVMLPGINPDDANIDDDIQAGWEEEEESGEVTDPNAAPSLYWAANPDFETMEISSTMDVNLVIKAPAKIKTFIVSVSDNFKSAISMFTGGKEELDLIDDPDTIAALASISEDLPTGDRLKGQTEVDFSLSDLIALINSVGTPGDDYVFTLNVTDELGQELEKSLTFHMPA